jgi:hypothetical protein
MSCNVGGIDRAVRIILGAALLCVAFLHVATGTWAIVFYVVGGIALVTGLVGYCPAWSLLGINTSGAGQAKPGSPAR